MTKSIENLSEKSRKKHILLLDADPSIRDSLASALRSENYCVTSASDEQEGLKQLSGDLIDLALVGLEDRDQARWHAVQKLDAANPRLPIILLTAQPEGTHHPLASRAQAWFPKPLLDLSLLFEKVTELTVQSDPTVC